MNKLLYCLLLAISISVSGYVKAKPSESYQLHGLNSFVKSDQQQISDWITHSVKATQEVLGPYPFQLELFVYPKRSNQPVPWANTWRDTEQQVHFYIDPRFGLQRFIQDWTAYHELSHPAIPFLGSYYSWFAEGFASYMQYQIMHSARLLEGTPEQNYRRKLASHIKRFDSSHSPAKVARQLMRKRNYPAAYWGGAWFFVMADKQLRQQNTNLIEVLRRYQKCCRLRDESVQDVVRSWDNLLQQPVFHPLLNAFENKASTDVVYANFSAKPQGKNKTAD